MKTNSLRDNVSGFFNNVEKKIENLTAMQRDTLRLVLNGVFVVDDIVIYKKHNETFDVIYKESVVCNTVEADMALMIAKGLAKEGMRSPVLKINKIYEKKLNDAMFYNNILKNCFDSNRKRIILNKVEEAVNVLCICRNKIEVHIQENS